MAASNRADWLIPAGLIALAFIPVAAGTYRLTMLAGGGPVTPENIRFFAAPVPVVLHIISVTLYCILGAFQFHPGLRRKRPDWHRAAGRVLVVSGIIAGLTGIWMALTYAIVPADSLLLHSFRLFFGAAMVLSIVIAYVAIRQRNVVRHQHGACAGDAYPWRLPARLFPRRIADGTEDRQRWAHFAGEMVGSWAGAMGHPQFMPSSFTRFAVDFRGEGRADIWNSVPDSLASTANYLKSHGWRPGETWGYEVKLPAGFDYRHVWSGTIASLGDWRAAGVVRASGRPFPREADKGRLYTPMGGHGPVFAVLPNFGVIKRYNNSDSYALAVGHLADRILGVGGFAASWPQDSALNAAQKRQVQERLLRRGHQIGPADGVIGPKTREAGMHFQAAAGLLPDGHVSGRLLAALG